MSRLPIFIASLISLVFVGTLFISQPVAATDDFVIRSFNVEMKLDRDEQGRSTLHTTETITADFQKPNTNRGIEREFIKDYDDHPTSFNLISVTDENDQPLTHQWSNDRLRIGKADTYVTGIKTYKLVYTQRDVTKLFEDSTNLDEFYWNAIGAQWRVPIENASIELTIAPDISNVQETELYCYTGSIGSQDRCEVKEGAKSTYRMSIQDLSISQPVTIAVGFEPGTFAEYKMGWLEKLFIAWIILSIITSVIGLVAIVWLLLRAGKLKYRDKELGTIVPEYLPPKDASIAVAGAVSPGYRSVLAAELTDLAVRRYIQILETRPRAMLLGATYDIQVLKDLSDLRNEEREILEDMFGHPPKIGERLKLKSLTNNNAVYRRFSDNDKKLRLLIRNTYGLKHVDETKRGQFKRYSKILLAIGILTLAPMLLVASLVAFTISKTLWVLSDKGLALRRYVRGLDMYIKVAEKDRIKMLQSPDGAEKIDNADPEDPAQIVKLYEKVLPYAILFGYEQQWAQRIGNYYEQIDSSPDWYSGHAAFNAVAFGAMMSSFSDSVKHTVTSSDPSSGGSSGGGFAGGGGGGGGGGGW